MLEYVSTFIAGGTPLIEGRLAILGAAASGLNLWYAFPLALLGNLIIIPITFKLLKLARFSDTIHKFFGKRIQKKINDYRREFEEWEELALLIFTAIPLPFSGAYSAILASRILNLKRRKSAFVIGLGVIIANVLGLLLSLGLIKLL
jgi:uncharacterized membrane protein